MVGNEDGYSAGTGGIADPLRLKASKIRAAYTFSTSPSRATIW